MNENKYHQNYISNIEQFKLEQGDLFHFGKPRPLGVVMNCLAMPVFLE